MIRVLLVDDHAAFREPLAFMIGREPDLTVVGQAGSLAEARPQLAGADVLVVDLDLPDGNGIELIRELRAANRRGLALVLSASGDERDRARAVEAGAAGLLHKSTQLATIIDAIRRLVAGEQLLPPQEVIELLRLAGQARERDREAQLALGRLTAREREVLQALAEGLTDKEIAERLHVSHDTARNHMVNILGKLGVNSRLQVLVFALRHGAVRLG